MNERLSLGNGYTLGEQIARGGQATIHRVTDGKDNTYAAKLFDEHGLGKPRQEAAIHQQLQGQSHVVRVVDFLDTPSQPALIMELADGSLFDHIRRGATPLRDALPILTDVFTGVRQVHAKGFSHFDVKPGNFVNVGDTWKITDFGLAEPITLATNTLSDSLPGTAWYVAPERILGNVGGPPADIYAASLLAFQLLSGHHPLLIENSTLGSAQAAHISETPILLVDAMGDTSPSTVLAGRVLSAGMQRDPKRRPSSKAMVQGFDAAAEMQAGSSPTHIEVPGIRKVERLDRAETELLVFPLAFPPGNEHEHMVRMGVLDGPKTGELPRSSDMSINHPLTAGVAG